MPHFRHRPMSSYGYWLAVSELLAVDTVCLAANARHIFFYFVGIVDVILQLITGHYSFTSTLECLTFFSAHLLSIYNNTFLTIFYLSLPWSKILARSLTPFPTGHRTPPTNVGLRKLWASTQILHFSQVSPQQTHATACISRNLSSPCPVLHLPRTLVQMPPEVSNLDRPRRSVTSAISLVILCISSPTYSVCYIYVSTSLLPTVSACCVTCFVCSFVPNKKKCTMMVNSRQ